MTKKALLVTRVSGFVLQFDLIHCHMPVTGVVTRLAADCFVLPSLREWLSVALSHYTLMEAMCAGLPVIAPKIRGNIDLIVNVQRGFLLEKGTSREYIEAVYRLRNDRKLAVSMGIWNKKRVRKFSCEEVASRMERIYKEVQR